MEKEFTLIQNCLQNKKDAIDTMYQQFAPKMFALCIRYAKDRSEAEDILQEGFIKVFNSLQKYSGNGSFEGWLRKIFVNTALNWIRSNKMYFEDITNIEYSTDSVFNNKIIEEISTNEILELINELPKGYKLIFNLYVIEGYKHKEIAEKLNISESTSKSQLLKARKALQIKIKENTEKLISIEV